jgi:hypothetical protein
MINFVVTVSIGIMLSFLYLAGIAPPLWVTVPLTTLYAGILLVRPPVRSASVAYLPRIATVLYFLPFVHLWGYLFSDGYIFFPTHVLSYSYQRDPHIIRSLASVGLIGIIGLTVGFRLADLRSSRLLQRARQPRAVEDNSTLGVGSTLLLAPLALGLAWLHAPQQSILSSRYVDIWSHNHGEAIGFAGGNIAAYSLVVLLAIDALKENHAKMRLFKYLLLGSVFLTIIIFFQILQGNRDSLGLILALLSLALISAGRSAGGLQNKYLRAKAVLRSLHGGNTSKDKTAVNRRMFVAGACLSLTFVMFQVLGEWRDSASSGHTASEALNTLVTEGTLFQGTWTAVLMTPMSTVGDLELGQKDYRFGKTYLDIVLSLPPGPICKLFGYVRPFDSEEDVGHGLAHEMTYGLGGTHVTVAPLLNFSAPGVLLILILIGWMVANVELLASYGSTWHVFLSCIFLLGTPGFFWYGEMYIIRAFMCAYGVWFGYKVLLASDSHRGLARFQLAGSKAAAGYLIRSSRLSSTEPIVPAGSQGGL